MAKTITVPDNQLIERADFGIWWPVSDTFFSLSAAGWEMTSHTQPGARHGQAYEHAAADGGAVIGHSRGILQVNWTGQWSPPNDDWENQLERWEEMSAQLHEFIRGDPLHEQRRFWFVYCHDATPGSDWRVADFGATATTIMAWQECQGFGSPQRNDNPYAPLSRPQLALSILAGRVEPYRRVAGSEITGTAPSTATINGDVVFNCNTYRWQDPDTGVVWARLAWNGSQAVLQIKNGSVVTVDDLE